MADKNQERNPQNQQQADRQAQVMQALRDFFKNQKATWPERPEDKNTRPGILRNRR